MQRILSILRHAKAQAEGDSDHARALTERGHADAARMGETLKAAGNLPQIVLCSDAVRTRQTLESLGLTLPTQLSSTLYLASAGELFAALQQCDNAVQHVMLVGHNPGVHELVVTLMGEAVHEEDVQQLALKFPTCALAQLTVALPHWRDLQPHSATLTKLLVGR